MNNTINILQEILGATPNISFREFVESPDFLNLGEEMYDFWKEELTTEVVEINELSVSGSLGGGKSYAAGGAYLLYRLYLLFKEPNPVKSLGLAPGSEVQVLYFSTNMTTAKKSGFKYIKNMVDRCKWFQENSPRDKNIDSSIRFSNGFSIDPVSSEGHQISLNVWGFVLDEANFREGVGNGVSSEYEEVYRLCQQLIDRQLSRFMVKGVLKSLAVFISSAAYESSFIEERLRLCETEPDKKAVRSVLYKICPERYSGTKFELFIGYGETEPQIVENTEQRNLLLQSTGLGEEVFEGLLEQVPIELKKQFEGDIHLAIQNHCGIPTSLKGSFFRNMELLKKAYVRNTERLETQPYKGTGAPIITISNEDESRVSDFIDVNAFAFPERPHSVFLDLSVQGDSGGLSIVRYDGQLSGASQHTHVLSLEIVPPNYPAMTRIRKIYDFMVELSEFVNIAAFGSDQYQSTQIRQDITASLGLMDSRLSIDSSDIPHLLWLNALVDERFGMHYIPNLEKEIVEAEHDRKRKRVVKRAGSTDDIFQSLVGAFFLSDTVVAQEHTELENIYKSGRLNLVGGKSYARVLRECGYTSNK